MQTAGLFAAAGEIQKAAAIETGGVAWLTEHRRRVEFWGREAGIDISRAIDSDLGETVAVPTDMPLVDVLIPFHGADARWVADAVLSAQLSQHVRPVIHVVADGCEFPFDLQPDCLRYRTDGALNWGPYRIQNSLVKHGHCQSEWLAILDGDDLMTPDRLWRHIALLRQQSADMISSAVANVAADDSRAARRRVQWQPVVRPGVRYPSCERGRCVNTCRTMRKAFFETMNGWADLKCSADFDFDNRARPIAEIIDDQRICGTRRLHGTSLSLGVAPPNSPDRQRDMQLVFSNQAAMKASPTPATAAQFGALSAARPLRSCPC